MIVFNSNTKDLIYPYNEKVSVWIKKWGITRDQLDIAVLETGSIHIKKVRHHLAKKGIIFSLRSFDRYLLYHFKRQEHIKH